MNTNNKFVVAIPPGIGTFKVKTWCMEKISPVAYHIAYRGGWKTGGVGWELIQTKGLPTLKVDDEKMISLLLLSI